mmetsp:Transcript_64929/g.175461  ORF Transcript_64929/g.175461 Transcript_64929/m.175461 type:complete len:430 (-) Transcript_64929:45-1334(-)
MVTSSGLLPGLHLHRLVVDLRAVEVHHGRLGLGGVRKHHAGGARPHQRHVLHAARQAEVGHQVICRAAGGEVPDPYLLVGGVAQQLGLPGTLAAAALAAALLALSSPLGAAVGGGLPVVGLLAVAALPAPGAAASTAAPGPRPPGVVLPPAAAAPLAAAVALPPAVFFPLRRLLVLESHVDQRGLVDLGNLSALLLLDEDGLVLQRHHFQQVRAVVVRVGGFAPAPPLGGRRQVLGVAPHRRRDAVLAAGHGPLVPHRGLLVLEHPPVRVLYRLPEAELAHLLARPVLALEARRRGVRGGGLPELEHAALRPPEARSRRGVVLQLDVVEARPHPAQRSRRVLRAGELDDDLIVRDPVHLHEAPEALGREDLVQVRAREPLHGSDEQRVRPGRRPGHGRGPDAAGRRWLDLGYAFVPVAVHEVAVVRHGA